MTISIEIEELYIRNGSGKMTCVQLQKPVVSIECAAEARKVALKAIEAALAVLEKGIDLGELNVSEGKFGANGGKDDGKPENTCV